MVKPTVRRLCSRAYPLCMPVNAWSIAKAVTPGSSTRSSNKYGKTKALITTPITMEALSAVTMAPRMSSYVPVDVAIRRTVPSATDQTIVSANSPGPQSPTRAATAQLSATQSAKMRNGTRIHGERIVPAIPATEVRAQGTSRTASVPTASQVSRLLPVVELDPTAPRGEGSRRFTARGRGEDGRLGPPGFFGRVRCTCDGGHKDSANEQQQGAASSAHSSYHRRPQRAGCFGRVRSQPSERSERVVATIVSSPSDRRRREGAICWGDALCGSHLRDARGFGGRLGPFVREPRSSEHGGLHNRPRRHSTIAVTSAQAVESPAQQYEHPTPREAEQASGSPRGSRSSRSAARRASPSCRPGCPETRRGSRPWHR